MNKIWYFIGMTICGLFILVVGVTIGERKITEQLKQPIQMEQCLSVCVEQFEKWGC